MQRYEQNNLFEKVGLKYSDIGSKEFYKLATILKTELKVHDWNDLKIDKITFKCDNNGGLSSGIITVKSNYFKDRQGISFFSDNEIGIAGWADSGNIIPFLNAFEKWVYLF